MAEVKVVDGGQAILLPVAKLKRHPDNPRAIRDERFQKLRESIRTFPEMLAKRPLVVVPADEGTYTVLGGNMRLEAAAAEGMKELPCIVAEGWSEQRQREFMIRDNANSGEWDWDALANSWDHDELLDWGLNALPLSEADMQALRDEPLEEGEEGDATEGGTLTFKFGEPLYGKVVDALAALDADQRQALLKALNIMQP